MSAPDELVVERWGEVTYTEAQARMKATLKARIDGARPGGPFGGRPPHPRALPLPRTPMDFQTRLPVRIDFGAGEINTSDW